MWQSEAQACLRDDETRRNMQWTSLGCSRQQLQPLSQISMHGCIYALAALCAEMLCLQSGFELIGSFADLSAAFIIVKHQTGAVSFVWLQPGFRISSPAATRQQADSASCWAQGSCLIYDLDKGHFLRIREPVPKNSPAQSKRASAGCGPPGNLAV